MKIAYPFCLHILKKHPSKRSLEAPLDATQGIQILVDIGTAKSCRAGTNGHLDSQRNAGRPKTPRHDKKLVLVDQRVAPTALDLAGLRRKTGSEVQALANCGLAALAGLLLGKIGDQKRRQQ